MTGEKIKDSLTLDDARRVIDAAMARAKEIGQPQDIAVVDAGGNLKAHVRMDTALIGSMAHLDQQGVHGDRLPVPDQGPHGHHPPRRRPVRAERRSWRTDRGVPRWHPART